MKRICSLLLAFCLILSFASALGESRAAKGDQPFVEGVHYGEKYKEYGAVPSMLNFGSASLSPGESLYDAKTNTIKKVKGTTLAKDLGRLTYYCYAKWQYAQRITQHEIEAMLVMTTPSGVYYATYGTWEIVDTRAKTICSWFFDVTDLLKRCLDENGGEFETGEYAFSMFFNDMSFRVTKVRVN